MGNIGYIYYKKINNVFVSKLVDIYTLVAFTNNEITTIPLVRAMDYIKKYHAKKKKKVHHQKHTLYHACTGSAPSESVCVWFQIILILQ